jgi:hypothetical protein
VNKNVKNEGRTDYVHENKRQMTICQAKLRTFLHKLAERTAILDKPLSIVLELASQLREEHVPQGEAQSDAKMRLNQGKIDQADAPGNKYQAGVMKKVVGDQQKEKSGKCADDAPKKTGESEMLRACHEASGTGGREKRAANNHDKSVPLFAHDPMPAACHRLFKGAHDRHSPGFSIRAEALRSLSHFLSPF